MRATIDIPMLSIMRQSTRIVCEDLDCVNNLFGKHNETACCNLKIITMKPGGKCSERETVSSMPQDKKPEPGSDNNAQ